MGDKCFKCGKDAVCECTRRDAANSFLLSNKDNEWCDAYFSCPFILGGKQYLTDRRVLIELNTPLDGLPDASDFAFSVLHTRFYQRKYGLRWGIKKYFSKIPSPLEPVTTATLLEISSSSSKEIPLSGIWTGYSYNSSLLLSIFVILGMGTLEMCDTGEYLYIHSPFGQAVLAAICP